MKNENTMNMDAAIKYSNGQTDTAEDFEAAMAKIRSRWPEAIAWQDGNEITCNDDVTCGRVLVWATEKDSVNDDGRRAIAEIIL